MKELNEYMSGLLERDLMSVEVEDGLDMESMEREAQDAKPKMGKKPRKPQTLEEHDKQHHPGGFDEKTMTCKFREKMKMIDSTDAADLIYATSDIHHSGIEDITDKECGTIVLAGDFMAKAKKQEDMKDAEKWWEEKFLPWCEDHKDQQIVIIGGNCDKWLYYNRDMLEWPENVHYLDDSETEVNGMKVYGTSWCPHNMNGAWEVDDKQLEEEFAKIPEGLDILVTHVPPKGEDLELDHDTEFDKHFGSEALTKAILEKKPKIVLCGHVHSGSHKPTKIGASIVMNVSRIDDDRWEKSFHGRRIGVERSDTGLGFLIDMDDEGKVQMNKKEDVPQEIVKLRDALREASISINRHIDKKDFKPNQKEIAKAIKAIEDTRGILEKFDNPKKKMLEAAIKGFEDSKANGYTKPISRIGRLYEGDRNGMGFGGFHFSWEPQHKAGKNSYYTYVGGGNYKPYSAFTNKFGKYKDPWKGGMGIDEILASFAAKKSEGSVDKVEDYEDDPFGENGLPISKK